MIITIIGRTSLENHNMIWAEIDDIEWGISEDFDIKTLQCDGVACDCIDSNSIAEYQAVAESIEDAAKEMSDIPWV